MKVLAAMSGGVDSAVAAARAVDAGHDVTGVHLALSQTPESHRNGARGCCSLEDSRDARRAADVLEIPFYVWDVAERFARDVVDDFVAEYAAGRTPNPCVRCNERIKFAAVLDRALALGFDAVCTGHYARIVDGRLHRAVDTSKDQSYVLAVLRPDQIAAAMFPLGDSLKSEVREEAADRGLAVAAKPDSHDICFIPSGDTAGWLRDRLGSAPGPVVDEAGAGARRARRDVRVHRRPAPRPCAVDTGRGRPAALRPVGVAGVEDGHGRSVRAARGVAHRVRRADLVRRAACACRCASALAQVRAHGDAIDCRVELVDGGAGRRRRRRPERRRARPDACCLRR